jgi:D-glycero-D-manno-heptose 1,7-bisphosphate phosphatase
VRAAAGTTARPALFLDRDGVIVKEVNYLHRAADVELHDGAAELIARANAAAVPVVAVTNQAGIARGYYGWAEYADVEAEIDARLAGRGARLDGILACPFHPDFTPGFHPRLAEWRKPGAGMLRLAAAALNLSLDRAWLIGDTAHDMAAARKAGLAGAVHVLTGHGARERAAALELAASDFAVLEAPDIESAGALLAPLLGLGDGGQP